MNVKALEKIEAAWIKYDWTVLKRYDTIPYESLLSIIDTIERFYKNKSAKELVLMKFSGIPAYVVISKDEYVEILDWLTEKFVELEMFETCAKIGTLKSKML